MADDPTLIPIANDDETPRPRAGVPRRARPASVYDLNANDLKRVIGDLGVPAYRARQIARWLYEPDRLVTSFEAMTDLPKQLRETLSASLKISVLEPVREFRTDNGDTIKTLYRTVDGQFVETVLMLYADRSTVCVSCQVGCAVGCAFCATGLGGLNRNLSAGEIVEQTINAARRARELGRPLTILVMMGMGEPLQNYAETMKFVRVLNDSSGFNFGARRITISTSGIVPRIDALAGEGLQINLAVSLHAPNDALRETLVPINKRWPIATLLESVDRYVAKTGRRVSFEYALMGGINDSDEIAAELG